MGPSPKLPEWLNNVLVTLPPDNAVRCLTLPPDHPIRKDHIDLKPDPQEEGPVFAFQAPVDVYLAEHTKTGGQPRTDIVTSRTVHGESVEPHGCCPTASLAPNFSLSNPGPGCTTSQLSPSFCPQRPSSASRFSLPTGISILKVSDTPLPFSTPGPFVPAFSTYGHVLDRGPTAQGDLTCDRVLPVAGWNGATSFPDPYATRTNRLDSHLPSDQDNDDESLESLSSFPNFVLDDVAGRLSSVESVPPAVYSGAPTENLSHPTPGTPPTYSENRSMIATLPRSLTWGSPTAMMRPSGVVDSTGRKPAVFLSDIQLGEKVSYGAFLLTFFLIESSLDGDPESLPNLHRSQVASAGVSPPRLVTPPPPSLSKHLSTDFGWISPTRTPDGFERIESVDESHYRRTDGMAAYTSLGGM
jgi:hypothetical protein